MAEKPRFEQSSRIDREFYVILKSVAVPMSCITRVYAVLFGS